MKIYLQLITFITLTLFQSCSSYTARNPAELQKSEDIVVIISKLESQNLAEKLSGSVCTNNNIELSQNASLIFANGAQYEFLIEKKSNNCAYSFNFTVPFLFKHETTILRLYDRIINKYFDFPIKK